MYAIIETGGKQYKVQKGDQVHVEKLGLDEGADVNFDRVLFYSDDDGAIKVGKPYIEGASIKGKVVKNGKGKKIIIFKYKPKKNERKKKGHRQPYTRVEITDFAI